MSDPPTIYLLWMNIFDIRIECNWNKKQAFEIKSHLLYYCKYNDYMKLATVTFPKNMSFPISSISSRKSNG